MDQIFQYSAQLSVKFYILKFQLLSSASFSWCLPSDRGPRDHSNRLIRLSFQPSYAKFPAYDTIWAGAALEIFETQIIRSRCVLSCLADAPKISMIGSNRSPAIQVSFNGSFNAKKAIANNKLRQGIRYETSWRGFVRDACVFEFDKHPRITNLTVRLARDKLLYLRLFNSLCQEQ